MACRLTYDTLISSSLHRWCLTQLRKDMETESRGLSQFLLKVMGRKVPGGNQSDRLIAMMGVMIYKIRFPLMSRNEFEIVKGSGLLRYGEIADLEANFRKNKTFCHTPRANFCRCSREKLPCLLCTVQSKFVQSKFNIPSVTGTTLTFSDTGFRLGWWEYFLRLGSDLEVEDDKCECLKYMSCPNHPNGKTFWVMNSVMSKVELQKHVMETGFNLESLKVKVAP